MDNDRRDRENLRRIAADILTTVDDECSRAEMLGLLRSLQLVASKMTGLSEGLMRDFHSVPSTWLCARAVYKSETWAYTHMRSMELCRHFVGAKDQVCKDMILKQLLTLIPTAKTRTKYKHLCMMAAASQEGVATLLLLHAARKVTAPERRALLLRGDLDPMFYAPPELQEEMFHHHKWILDQPDHRAVAGESLGEYAIDHLLAILIRFSNKNSVHLVSAIAEHIAANSHSIDAHALLESVQRILQSSGDRLGMFAHFSLRALCEKTGLDLDTDFESSKLDAGLVRMLRASAKTEVVDTPDKSIASADCEEVIVID
jgi:hypothetical protein